MPPRLVKSWKDLKLVEVVWMDAVLDTEHQGDLSDPKTADKFGGMAECSDVGYLIRKSKTEVVLAVGVCRLDSTYRHSNTIPTSWVKSITELKR